MSAPCSVCLSRTGVNLNRLCPACRRSFDRWSRLAPHAETIAGVIEWSAARARRISRAKTLAALSQRFEGIELHEPQISDGGVWSSVAYMQRWATGTWVRADDVRRLLVTKPAAAKDDAAG